MSESNEAQVDYWNGRAGEKWVAVQVSLDAMLSPATAELKARAGSISGLRDGRKGHAGSGGPSRLRPEDRSILDTIRVYGETAISVVVFIDGNGLRLGSG